MYLYGYSEYTGWYNISYDLFGYPGSLPSGYRNWYTVGELTYLASPSRVTSGDYIYYFLGWHGNSSTVSYGYVGTYDAHDIKVTASWSREKINKGGITFSPIFGGLSINNGLNNIDYKIEEFSDNVQNYNESASLPNYINSNEFIASEDLLKHTDIILIISEYNSITVKETISENQNTPPENPADKS